MHTFCINKAHFYEDILCTFLRIFYAYFNAILHALLTIISGKNMCLYEIYLLPDEQPLTHQKLLRDSAKEGVGRELGLSEVSKPSKVIPK